MPLVQTDLPRPLFAEKGTRISEEIHQASIEALEIPADDKPGNRRTAAAR